MSNTPRRTMRITDDDYTTLKRMAKSESTTISGLINGLLARHASQFYGIRWQGISKPGHPKLQRKPTPTNEG